MLAFGESCFSAGGSFRCVCCLGVRKFSYFLLFFTGPITDKDETNYIKYFREAMLFFKKSEQEKKVGNFTIKGIQDILGFHCMELF